MANDNYTVLYAVAEFTGTQTLWFGVLYLCFRRLRRSFNGVETYPPAFGTPSDCEVHPRESAETDSVFAPRLRKTAFRATYLPSGSSFFWVHSVLSEQ